MLKTGHLQEAKGTDISDNESPRPASFTLANKPTSDDNDKKKVETTLLLWVKHGAVKLRGC